MVKTSRFALSFAVICLFILISGCGLLPKSIQEIFISATPTSTNTPTSTPTPTATATATSTPLPPIFISACTYIEFCPGAIPLDDIIGSPASPIVMNNVQIPYDQTVRVIVGWIAKDQEHLQENLSHIKWTFSIDGQGYFSDQWLTNGTVPDEKDPSIEYPGTWFGVNMMGWKVGQPHFIRIGYTLDASVNDGWNDISGGYTLIYTYYVKPAELPTATPSATATLTPQPTNTPRPRPTMIPYTKTPVKPACNVDSIIEINNTTGGTLTIYLSGTAKFTFVLGGGFTNLNVCAGNYSYTAYGCGGASDTGSINSGESHKFYCQ